jgi:hypothetical protein
LEKDTRSCGAASLVLGLQKKGKYAEAAHVLEDKKMSYGAKTAVPGMGISNRKVMLVH